jgi:hypothetical protein
LIFFETAPSVPLDIALVVDSSTEIPSQNWGQIVRFLQGFIGRVGGVTSDPNSNRFGLISYATQPTVHFRFNTLQGNKRNTNAVVKLMLDIPRQTGQIRRIDEALKMAGVDLFSVKGGQRPKSKKVMGRSLVIRKGGRMGGRGGGGSWRKLTK